MGVGLYGHEKIKWLTRKREREGEFLRITIITNSYHYLMVGIILNFDTLSRFFLLIKNSFFLSF
ncbi:hypothetical protein HpBT353_12220 [Helicobacter pylori]